MPAKKAVIQVPLNKELLETLNALSRKRGQTRSALIREACERYIRDLEEERLDRIYEEGYRRFPEGSDLGEAQKALLSDVWEEEDWSDLMDEDRSRA